MASHPTHPVVDGGGQPEEQADQAGNLIASDGLQFRVPLVLDVKLPQPVDDLEAAGEVSPRGQRGHRSHRENTPLQTTQQSCLIMGDGDRLVGPPVCYMESPGEPGPSGTWALPGTGPGG